MQGPLGAIRYSRAVSVTLGPNLHLELVSVLRWGCSRCRVLHVYPASCACCCHMFAVCSRTVLHLGISSVHVATFHACMWVVGASITSCTVNHRRHFITAWRPSAHADSIVYNERILTWWHVGCLLPRWASLVLLTPFLPMKPRALDSQVSNHNKARAKLSTKQSAQCTTACHRPPRCQSCLCNCGARNRVHTPNLECLQLAARHHNVSLLLLLPAAAGRQAVQPGRMGRRKRFLKTQTPKAVR